MQIPAPRATIALIWVRGTSAGGVLLLLLLRVVPLVPLLLLLQLLFRLLLLLLVLLPLHAALCNWKAA